MVSNPSNLKSLSKYLDFLGIFSAIGLISLLSISNCKCKKLLWNSFVQIDSVITGFYSEVITIFECLLAKSMRICGIS